MRQPFDGRSWPRIPPTWKRRSGRRLSASRWQYTTPTRRVTALEALRPDRMFIPIVLGMICGLRRGEISALRWRDIDLDRGQISVILSTEQTKEECREKELEELPVPNRQPLGLRRQGVAQPQGEASGGVAAAWRQAEQGSSRCHQDRRRALAAPFNNERVAPADPHEESSSGSDSTTLGTATPPTCSRATSTRRSFRRGWGTARLRSPWTSTVT